jgi:23S rRNA (uracil1939-C5)-methyltransferase
MPLFNKQSVHSLEIESLAYGGAGVAKPEGFVVFVPGALPGDRVRARIVKKKKNHAEARLEAVESPSPDRIEAPCPLFGACGGCTWQHLPYDRQLEWKQRQVEETLEHLGGLSELPAQRPILASPEVWNYRNKMEYSFGQGQQGEVILGFHEPGRYDRIFEVPKCLIHPEPFDALLKELTAYAREHGLSAYEQRRHTGLLRHAVMRHSRKTGGVVLVLITGKGELPDPGALAARLRGECPALQGFVWGVNTGLADVATIERTAFTWGNLRLREELNGLEFDISPLSFFQTNPSGAEVLYRSVLGMAEIGPHDRVLDAYCGTGSIALHCARAASRVVGVEISLDAIRDARVNARTNGIRNATFIAAPMREGLKLAAEAGGGSFTRVIIDPPRGGMDKRSLAGLIDLRAPVFVYVSCNPSTLARDLQTLIEAGYRVDAVQAVDMFPHTYHIEAVVRLVLGPA